MTRERVAKRDEEDLKVYVRRRLLNAPPMTDAQKARIAVLFRPGNRGDNWNGDTGAGGPSAAA